MKKHWRLILAVLPLLFIVGCPVCEHFRGKILLSRYKAKLVAAGEKLTIAELVPPTQEGENGAQELLSAITLLRGGKVLELHYPVGMKLVGPGTAAVTHTRTNWLEGKDSYAWEQLRPELETNAAVLATIRATIKKPVLRVTLDYSGGFEMLLPHLATVKRAAITLSVDALMALHVGDNERAFNDIAAEIELQRMFEHEPILISQLVRIVIRGISFSSTWEALQKDGWTDAQLAELQRLWQQGDFLGGMEKSFQMERAEGAAYFERFRESNAEAVKMLNMSTSFFNAVGSSSGTGNFYQDAKGKASEITKNYARIPLWRFAWSRHDEKHYLELLQTLLEATRAGIESKSYAKTKPLLETFEVEFQNPSFYDECRYLVSPLIAAALSRSNLKAVQSEAMRSLVVSAIALKRHQLRHGSSPDSLESLVPGFLAAVPVDYWDGKPIRYHKEADGSWTLYSVGENCVDDGGNGEPRKNNSSFAIYNAKDLVWPKPATAEQIAAFEKKSR